jgi:hypothetical protein
MKEDVKDIIQRKIWAADELLSQAERLKSKVNKLSDKTRKNIPVFSGEWSEDNIKRYLEAFGAAIKDPFRYMNRKLLEDVGVQTKGIPETIFDDSGGIKEVVDLFNDLKKSNNNIANILTNKGYLSEWLKEGIDKTKGKLNEILNTKTALQRILENDIDEQLRDELVQRSVANTGFVDSAEDIISKVKFIDEFSIQIHYDGKFDEFSKVVGSVHTMLSKLQNEYGIRREETSELVEGKTLQEVCGILEKKLEDLSVRKTKLLEEWKMYSVTLRSIGHEVMEAPTGLHGLEEEIKKLESECLSALGEPGFKLLRFLRGEESFPEISVTDIRNALELLRPVLSKSLKEEG